MANDLKDLLLLFERPNEPLFTPKEEGQTVFDIPQKFYTPKYKEVANDIQTRFHHSAIKRRVPLKDIPDVDLSFADSIPLDGTFSLFNRHNCDVAGELVKLLMNVDASLLLSTACYIKDRVNTYMYQYALSVTMAHRPDTKSLMPPSIVQIFPDQFVPGWAFPKALETANSQTNNRQIIEIPPNYTATNREAEQRLAYFREDIGVNAHHWHWHLVYPGSGDDRIAAKDRRGELFYYMHQQIIARYNVERFANDLPKVRPMHNFREPIREAYFPKITRSRTNTAWPPRTANSTLTDVNRPANNLNIHVSDMERWRDRIMEAIAMGNIISSTGAQIPLTAETGIDILGNLVEPSSLSANPTLYGNLHNAGHDMISYVHDPEEQYMEDHGIMGDVAVAMRDPIFYRWHSFIDAIFVQFKNTLPEYSVPKELAFDGVAVESVKVVAKGEALPNALTTHWQRSDVDLSTGLDFGPNGNVFAQFTHLQHVPFEYEITVNNNVKTQRKGTCRIFLGPTVDDRDNAIPFSEQRTLMIELDKFTVTLQPGRQVVRRRSNESSVTIPRELYFRNLGNRPVENPAALAEFNFCGCGWPEHMLLPKSKAAGTDYELFVMISNFEHDSVNEDVTKSACSGAESFCGLRDQKYPDRRAMGYPFDRKSAAKTLAAFAGSATNMAVQKCNIKFVDEYRV